ncbi:MAG: WbqC family protein, partial [Planctomycetes bacterium]|nr:WbqC family protein [Planctomycetota bacterium]
IISSHSQTIDALAYESLKRVSDFLDIHTEFIRSTRIYGNRHLKGQERAIDICLQEKATVYVNAPGGRGLYSHEAFEAKGITLRFLDTLPHEYRQFGEEFHPHLSIIDVLMFCGSEGTKALLQKYSLGK